MQNNDIFRNDHTIEYSKAYETIISMSEEQAEAEYQKVLNKESNLPAKTRRVLVEGFRLFKMEQASAGSVIKQLSAK